MDFSSTDMRLLAIVTSLGMLLPIVLVAVRAELSERARAVMLAVASALLVLGTLGVVSRTNTLVTFLFQVLRRGEDLSSGSDAGVDLALLLGSMVVGLIVAGLALAAVHRRDASAAPPPDPVPAHLPDDAGHWPAAWGAAEVMGDAAPHHGPEPVAAERPATGAPQVALLLLGTVVLGLVFAQLTPSVSFFQAAFGGLFDQTRDADAWSIGEAITDGLVIGLPLLAALYADADETAFDVPVAAVALAAVGIANAVPYFARAVYENEYWTMIGAGLACGLLAPVALYAAGRAVRRLTPLAVWSGVALTLALLIGRGYLEAAARSSPFFD